MLLMDLPKNKLRTGLKVKCAGLSGYIIDVIPGALKDVIGIVWSNDNKNTRYFFIDYPKLEVEGLYIITRLKCLAKK